MPYNAEIYLYANSSEDISQRILSSNPNITVEEAKHILTNDEEHKALMEERHIKSHLSIYTNHDTMMQCYKKGMTIDEANLIIENYKIEKAQSKNKARMNKATNRVAKSEINMQQYEVQLSTAAKKKHETFQLTINAAVELRKRKKEFGEKSDEANSQLDILLQRQLQLSLALYDNDKADYNMRKAQQEHFKNLCKLQKNQYNT